MATTQTQKRLKALVPINFDGRMRIPGTKTEEFDIDEAGAEQLLAVNAAEDITPTAAAEKKK